MGPAGISDLLTRVLALVFFCTVLTVAAANGAAGTASPGAGLPDYEIRLFIPDRDQIHSDQVNDATNGKSGEVLFATRFGLSAFNGTWSTRHVNRGDNITDGLLDDFITCLEYDHDGRLWIGYPGGIQIYNGAVYYTIRDQQLLKSLRVNAIQRWGDSMWVGTGNAGLHRFSNGTWTWYQPFSKGGPQFSEVDSMAVDPASDALLIATVSDGIWIVSSKVDPVTFRRLDAPLEGPAPRWHARQDPLGGVYFFDDHAVSHYSHSAGLAPVLTAHDLTPQITEINDLAAGNDGMLYFGTDDGIYLWQDGAVFRHLGRFEGIGTSYTVRWVYLDAKDRLWFATQGNVGYYAARGAELPIVTIRIINQSATDVATPGLTPVPSVSTAPSRTIPPLPEVTAKEPSLLERITAFLSDILSWFNIRL